MRALTKERTVRMKTRSWNKKIFGYRVSGFDNRLVIAGRSWSECSPEFRRVG